MKLRLIYFSLMMVTVVLGLFCRQGAMQLPWIVGRYAPDTLWAMMVYWLVAAAMLRTGVLHVALIALGISYLVELSQLYHAPWIDAIRRMRIGGLILGFGFLWSDIVCYTVGVILAALMDRRITGRAN